MTFSLRELREHAELVIAAHSENSRALPVKASEALLALVEAVEAARAVRKRHPANAESADLVLDRALARFTDHEETR